MKRLKLLIVIFCLAVSLPLAFVVWQTYQSLSQEEEAQLRFFSEALFDEMEKEMAELVKREEARVVDEYHFTLANGKDGFKISPLARAPKENYIMGYLQNNPDGSFKSPLVPDMGRIPPENQEIISQLSEINTLFNQKKKFSLPKKPAPLASKYSDASKIEIKKKKKASFADRYMAKEPAPHQKIYLGSQSIRKEQISERQAFNISEEKTRPIRSRAAGEKPSAISGMARAEPESMAEISEDKFDGERIDAPSREPFSEDDTNFQVEVAPLQSVFISRGRFFIFRRIVINEQIYRQGFVLAVVPFLNHLLTVHFDKQPMARFTGLRLQVMENGFRGDSVQAGIQNATDKMIIRRTFPAPFDFLNAVLTAASAPPSPARKPLGIALWVLGLFMLVGLMAIYKSAKTMVDLSERRSQFVSSVTHELKTPLTNIRMYIEMLEQGIAATPEKEQAYLSILGSESTRLSRLINNVLELAKLEKKQRHFDMRKGKIDDVLTEVHTVMAHKLDQEGFKLAFERTDIPAFPFDREVLIQVLINLIENSIKFGQMSPEKKITIFTGTRDGMAFISISDTGPGIPRRALKKVFDDFYRVNNKPTRTTGGTGIGLALVKKFIVAMGGRVEAANNDGPGCTITLLLPLS